MGNLYGLCDKDYKKFCKYRGRLMSEKAETKIIRPHYVTEKEWERKSIIERVHYLKIYASQVTSIVILKDIKVEIYYYENVLHQIANLTKV